MSDFTDRRSVLGLLARSPADLLAERFATLNETPTFTWLRRPETGMVMLRARIGGDGAQFNLGEMTLTRCALRLSGGAVGVGAVRGRSVRQAEVIALCDALLQQVETAPRVHKEVIAPLASAEQARHTHRAAEVAASRVDFFTLVRGED
jgi:alpha-D-ribose 1-methylphosphonate 5-triphosphate synthase subunit PhnG